METRAEAPAASPALSGRRLEARSSRALDSSASAASAAAACCCVLSLGEESSPTIADTEFMSACRGERGGRWGDMGMTRLEKKSVRVEAEGRLGARNSRT
eukprot:4341519-Pleurochrysis_carterae.AAC.3